MNGKLIYCQFLSVSGFRHFKCIGRGGFKALCPRPEILHSRWSFRMTPVCARGIAPRHGYGCGSAALGAREWGAVVAGAQYSAGEKFIYGVRPPCHPEPAKDLRLPARPSANARDRSLPIAGDPSLPLVVQDDTGLWPEDCASAWVYCGSAALGARECGAVVAGAPHSAGEKFIYGVWPRVILSLRKISGYRCLPAPTQGIALCP